MTGRDYSLIGVESRAAVESGLADGQWFQAHIDPPTLTALASGHVLLIQNGKKADKFQQVRYSGGKVAVR